MSGRRRGFTLLETVLAAALGSVVVLVSMGLFALIDRTDRLARERARDSATLSQLHMVMDRTFGSLVMLDSSSAAIKAEEGGAPGARPRMLLEGDPAMGSSRSTPVQRLEVVLARPPVPPGFGDSLMVDTSYMAEDPDIRASRGVFELRPGRDRRGHDDGTWTLWWRPLPPMAEGEAVAAFRLDPRQDARAVVVARGLTRCHWLAFKNRERSPAIEAARFDSLPAYMEMEVATASGVQANWMFEVQWSNGPETALEEEAAALLNQGGGPGATGTTGPTGQPSGAPASETGARPTTRQRATPVPESQR